MGEEWAVHGRLGPLSLPSIELVGLIRQSTSGTDGRPAKRNEFSGSSPVIQCGQIIKLDFLTTYFQRGVCLSLRRR